MREAVTNTWLRDGLSLFSTTSADELSQDGLAKQQQLSRSDNTTMSSFNCTKWGRWLPASHKSLRITTQFIELGNWKSQTLQLEKWSDVTSPPSLFHGWLLHTVRISLASNRSALLCFLGMKAARSAWLELSQGWYRPRIEATANVLSKFDSHIQNARYCRTSKWKSLTNNLQAWSEGLPSMPAEGVLADTQIEVLLSARALSKAPDAYLKRSREDYVAKALSENIDLFETVESMPLTAKQREACVIDDDNWIAPVFVDTRCPLLAGFCR